jgi:hypothetical protein
MLILQDNFCRPKDDFVIHGVVGAPNLRLGRVTRERTG